MIRFFLYSIVALAVGATLALLLAADPGYVLVNFRGTTVEATLATIIVAVLAVILLAVATVWLLRLLNPLRWFNFTTAPSRTTANGLQLLLLGRWQEAYKSLVENAERAEVPELNYLLATIAAYQRADHVSWNWCLDQAERKAPGSALGIKSFRALLETRAGHPETALPTLLTILRLMPASPFVLQQVKDIYVAQGRWDELAALAPELEKQKAIDGEELKAIHAKAQARQLESAALAGADSLRRAWHELPKALKHDEKLTAVYAHKLLELGQDTDAGALLTAYLKKDWSDPLAALLGYVHVRNPQEALHIMEGWLKQHPNHPVLLLTLGRLSLRNQLWGKAREYFDLALRSANAPELIAEINAELARLLDHLGEHDKSLACYQQALGLLKRPLPDVPLPAKR